MINVILDIHIINFQILKFLSPFEYCKLGIIVVAIASNVLNIQIILTYSASFLTV